MDKTLLQRRGLLVSALTLGGTALAGRALAADAAPSAGAAGAAPAQPTALTVAPTSQAGVSPRLTFHAVDTFHGASGAGLKVELSRFEGGEWKLLKTTETTAGGRPAEPLLVGDEYRAGRYEVLVDVGAYFARLGAQLPQPAFLSKVPLRIAILDTTQRVHLPLLFSPWGYSFYRGS
jgi:5-hydroxyisourate hydrolase